MASCQWQREYESVRGDWGAREPLEPGCRDRQDEDADDREIQWKHPSRGAQIRQCGVLHDGDVKLPRQADDRQRSEQRL